jgi:hypothetical protein
MRDDTPWPRERLQEGTSRRWPGGSFHVAELMATVAPDSGRQRNGAPSLGPAGSEAAERMRKAVPNRIRQAVARIADAHQHLGRHLQNAVRTGSRYAYTPERPDAVGAR